MTLPPIHLALVEHEGRTYRVGSTYAAKPVPGRDPARQRRRTIERIERRVGYGCSVTLHLRDRRGSCLRLNLREFARWAGEEVSP